MAGTGGLLGAFAVGFAVAAMLLGNVKLPSNLMSFVTEDDMPDYCNQTHNDSAPVVECFERHTNLQSDCDHFFVGDAWPSSGYMKNNKAATLRICQTHAGDKTPLFATAYNVHYRIPEYTASAITRDPDVPGRGRPGDRQWKRVQLGLCGKEIHDEIFKKCNVTTKSWGVSLAADIPDCQISSRTFNQLTQRSCPDCQAMDYDFTNCGTFYNKGHLNPNAINNKTADVQDGTFSMINVAPQDDDFNQCVWQPYECAVGIKAEEVYKNAVNSNSKTLYVITGTKLGQQTTWIKGRVAIPGYYWKALCYPGDKSAGLSPFGVGFYGPNIDCSKVTSLPLDKFEAWLYNGTDAHLFPGSVCAGPVDNWDGLDDYVAEIAHGCRNEHIQDKCESKWREERCGTSG